MLPEQKLAGDILCPELEVLSGSRLYGVATPESDIDTVAVVWPPFEYRLRLLNPGGGRYSFETTTVVEGKTERVIFSVDKFIDLLIKGNTRALETLFAARQPEVYCIHIMTSLGRRLVGLVDSFVSKQLRKAFGGYGVGEIKMTFGETTGQLGAIRKGDLADYGYSRKNAYNALRILVQGRDIAETGTLTFPSYCVPLMKDIREGKLNPVELRILLEHNLAAMDQAFEKSTLPDHPSYSGVNQFLIDIDDGLL